MAEAAQNTEISVLSDPFEVAPPAVRAEVSSAEVVEV